MRKPVTVRYLALGVAVLALAGCGNAAGSGGATGGTGGSSTATKLQNHLHSIAIVPNHPGEVYFGAHYYLYRSNDGGTTWSRLSNQMMLSLTLDPSHPTHIWAVSLQHGLVASTNGGKAWTQASKTIGNGDVTGVLMVPSAHAVFAYGSGIYRSSVDGSTWAHQEKGKTVFSMAYGSGQTLYAATGNGLFVSQDAGGRWKAAKVIGNQPIAQVVAAGPMAYAITAVGLMRSSDDGAKWSLLAHAPQGVEIIGASQGAPRTVVAEVAQKGFYLSTDAGTTWKKTSGIGPGRFNGSTVQFAASDPKIGYTGSWGLHVYTTHDGGLRWTQTTTLK
jgi:photosystem II stability/assembly factor-like uncharacterized protein